MRSLLGKRSRPREVTATNVNLIPLICLFCILVPMLLVTAVFERLAALKTHLPQASTITRKHGPETRPTGIVELRVGVHDNGFSVQATLSHTPDGQERHTYEDVQQEIPLNEDRYDLDRLRKVLVSLKEQYPRHEEVVLVIDDRVSYDVIVQTMDTCREEVYVDEGGKRRRVLFPSIALSETFDEEKGFDGIRKGTSAIDKQLGVQ